MWISGSYRFLGAWKGKPQDQKEKPSQSPIRNSRGGIAANATASVLEICSNFTCTFETKPIGEGITLIVRGIRRSRKGVYLPGRALATSLFLADLLNESQGFRNFSNQLIKAEFIQYFLSNQLRTHPYAGDAGLEPLA